MAWRMSAGEGDAGVRLGQSKRPTSDRTPKTELDIELTLSDPMLPAGGATRRLPVSWRSTPSTDFRDLVAWPGRPTSRRDEGRCVVEKTLPIGEYKSVGGAFVYYQLAPF